MSEDKEPFLARWSRIKAQARRGESEAKPSPPVAEGAEPAAGAPAAELPPLDSLQGLASEYREFLQPRVEEGLRRAALKKLFSDPHFNTMDGLDVYIDDYSKAEPIPEAMLKTLEQAKGLLFEPEEKRTDEESQAAEQASGESTASQGPDTAAPAQADRLTPGSAGDAAPAPIPNAKT